jgi:Ala-tRNA(Pro) deacylase
LQDIYKTLKDFDIPYDEYRHQAVFTTAEADTICKDIPGKQAKNLFLTNDKGTKHFLVTIPHDKKAGLKDLARFLNQKSLRFASPERLHKYLGLTPGSVSPFGLINDANKEVEFIIDKELISEKKIFIHPNINTATLGVKTSDFKKFLTLLGYKLKIYEDSLSQ